MTGTLTTHHALATVAYLVMHGRSVTRSTYQARVALGAMLGSRIASGEVTTGTVAGCPVAMIVTHSPKG